MCKANFISQCSHPYFCQKLNREVCHSPTWHSSESESALERFEPVAVVQQLRDGRGTLFAPVAARRQKVLKEESFPLFVLFVLFGQAKRTLKEKKHKATFALSYFCMTKRRVQGGGATSERRRRDGVYQKSAKRAFTPVSATPTNALRALVNSPLFANSSRVHELVARAMRGECVRQRTERKSAVLHSPQIHLYHACEHITRRSRADSCTHCPHAR